MLLTAREAADRLGIKLDSLYAYVSRGRLRSVAVTGSRERRYRTEDIDALRAARGGGAAGTAPAAGREAAIPVIDSTICLIEDGRLYYRGQDAVRRSDSATLEDIARLLWGGAAVRQCQLGRDASEADVGLGLIEHAQMRLAVLAAADPSPPDLTQASLLCTGQQILNAMVGCLAPTAPSSLPVHRRLAAHWRLDELAGDVLRRCLVLLADHELNASTFVARCVASTGATLYAAVSAALGALSGPRHGGAAARAEALFHEAKASGDPISAMAERLARGEALPGIGHPLYPEGDPRAVAILYALSLIVPQARRLVGRRPNVDFALAAATTALGLPLGAALGLFVIGRTVGWIAHAIEQYHSGIAIRPRARYTGPPHD
jgi:citrate synthase